ncbi:MAG TPA: hypothetical protein DCS88_08615 [Alphaproteobacteria bacterium]|nr:hypothetical protein [Alphaproteobacteria bacterium]
MSLFIPCKKATVLIPSGPQRDPNRKHLFVLLTDPDPVRFGVESVLIVPISSVREGIPYDRTCVLESGDHPFIKHRSFVSYAWSRIEDVTKIMRGVQGGQLVAHKQVNEKIFGCICQGVDDSPQTPWGIQKFYHTSKIFL